MSRKRDAAAQGARCAARGTAAAVLIAGAASVAAASVPTVHHPVVPALPVSQCPPGEVLTFAPHQPTECKR